MRTWTPSPASCVSTDDKKGTATFLRSMKKGGCPLFGGQMRVQRWAAAAVALAANVALLGGQGGGRGQQQGVPIKPGEECPPGMTEWRHLSCRAPSATPPSIVDYRPKSTVVATEHLVPKAKFPVVDIHNHTDITAANIDADGPRDGRAEPSRDGEPLRRQRHALQGRHGFHPKQPAQGPLSHVRERELERRGYARVAGARGRRR